MSQQWRTTSPVIFCSALDFMTFVLVFLKFVLDQTFFVEEFVRMNDRLMIARRNDKKRKSLS